MTADPHLIHGTAIAVEGAGLLITGASGAGKSSLAMQLIAMGAALIADDQVTLWPEGDGLVLRKPEGLPEAIEARGVGLLAAPMRASAPLCAVVDLDIEERDRLPAARTRRIAGVEVKVFANAVSGHFPSAILLYLRHGLANGVQQ